jgi:hypothetical protein
MEICLSVRPVDVTKKIIRTERNGKESEAMHKKSQKCFVLRIYGGGTTDSISMKLGTLV